ncbi:hypothetical protein [Thalassovita aquimarina]|uniref:Uncharacterized protein n=1 Tax=Thalassovita aquimarina TaxID=2785917 RepID=A0ABS5HTG4_9RHOB|nr:hypothetical protein [Thalassovita aquimarina]MBR9652193.1 hypothetical protein [Thalassovita aquimarina]
MNADLVLVLGIVVIVFSISSAVSAWSNHRPFNVSALTLAVGGALVVYACVLNDWQYRPGDVPAAFVNVIALLMR